MANTNDTNNANEVVARENQGNNVFETAKVLKNEVVKEEDMSMAFDSGINNIGIGLKSIIENSQKDFIVGGKITVNSGGKSITVAPFFVYSNARMQGAMNINENVIEFGQKANDVTYTIAIRIETQEKENRQRSFIYPDIGRDGQSYTQTIATQKERIATVFSFNQNNQEEIPLDFDSCVKIAEVKVPKNDAPIQQDDIKEITATSPDTQNSDWEATDGKKNSVFKIMPISDFFATFLKQHNEDGTHRDKVITKDNIMRKMTDPNPLTSKDLCIGRDITNLQGELVAQEKKIDEVLQDIVDAINTTKEYIHNQGGFTVVAVAKTLTQNIDLSCPQDDCNEGTNVLLTGQGTTSENGLYVVQTDKTLSRPIDSVDWASPSGYEKKLIYATEGEHKGCVYCLADSCDTLEYNSANDIRFVNIAISPYQKPNTIILRNERGNAQVAEPQEPLDIAVKKTVDDAKRQIDEDMQEEREERSNADTGLQDQITQNNTRHNQTEDDLQTQINAETRNREQADRDLHTTIAGEISRAVSQEATNRDNAIDNQISRVDNRIDGISGTMQDMQDDINDKADGGFCNDMNTRITTNTTDIRDLKSKIGNISILGGELDGTTLLLTVKSL